MFQDNAENTKNIEIISEENQLYKYVFEKIVNFLSKENIECSFSQEEKLSHSTDASVFKIIPSIIIYPKDKFELASFVKFINTLKLIIQESVSEVQDKSIVNDLLNISVQAGATCMSGGSLNAGIIIDLKKYFIKIGKLEKVKSKNNTEIGFLNVEMGVYFRDIESYLGRYDFVFPAYTSSKATCGIGGMLGNNASGEMSIRYGATIDNVEELEVLHADGSLNVYKRQEINAGLSSFDRSILSLYTANISKLTAEIGNVSKSSSGYKLDKIVKRDDSNGKLYINLAKLFIGAQGTLGIVLSAKLKVVKLPQNPKMYLLAVNDLSELPRYLNKIQNLNPECVEVFDRNTFERAKVILPDETRNLINFFQDNINLIILIQLDEHSSIEKEKIGIEVNEEIRQSAWKVRRSAYGVFRDIHEGGLRAVPCIEDMIVPIDKFDMLIPRLMDILNRYSVQYGYHGHIGDGALRIIPLFDFADLNVTQKIIDLEKEVFALVKELGGNICADHSDGIVRSPFLRDFYGETIINTFLEIKKIFDPNNILNNKKKTYFKFDQMHKYIDRKDIKVRNGQILETLKGNIETGKYYKTNKDDLIEKLEQLVNCSKDK